MATAEISITVERPLEEVFAYIVNIKNLNEWVSVVLDSWPVSGNLPEAGSIYIVKAQIMGKTMEILSEVVDYKPNRLYAYKSYGFLTYVDTMLLEETKNGTLVTEHLDMKSEGRFLRLLDPLKLIISKRSHLKNQQQLKRILEGGKVAVLA
jgi:carbon monoxide dehydrogenase subunit G